MNKNTITKSSAKAILALAIFMSGSIAKAEIREDGLRPVMICQDARDVRDGAIEVVIFENSSENRITVIGENDYHLAVVSERNVAGSTEIGRFEKVINLQDKSFKARNFKLELGKPSADVAGAYESRLESRVGIQTTVEGNLGVDLLCSPAVTTMTGFGNSSF